MGLMIRSDAETTDTTAPVIKVYDRILTDGSLVLFDTANPMGDWTAGVPADGGYIDNLARDFIGALITASNEDAYRGPVSKSANLFTTKARFERTARGGLHGIVSQTQTINSGEGYAISLPNAAKQYVVNNPGHTYFISVWKRQTRSIKGLDPVADRNPAFLSLAAYPSPDVNNLAVFSKNGINMANRTGYRGTGAESDQVEDWQGIYNAAGSGWNGTAPTSISSFYGYVTEFARPANGNSTVSGHPSFIFYRFYMEDLTVSGRSYATVDALDQALFDEAFNSSTGRYRNDHFSAPNVVLL